MIKDLCECDKSCGIGEYLDYKNCKCRNKIINKLIEECSENIDGNKILHNKTLDAIILNTVSLDTKACNSCTIYIVLFAIFFITNIYISSVFIYFYWRFKKKIMFVLSLSRHLFIKYNSIECNPVEYIKMGNIKEINIKNQAY